MKHTFYWHCTVIALLLCFFSCQKSYDEEEYKKNNQQEGTKNDSNDTEKDSSADNDKKDDNNHAQADTVSIKEFKSNTIGGQIWVKGYIVGAASGRPKTLELAPPFTVKTALLLADDPQESSINNVISVRLAAGKYRDALNLVDNPDNKGKCIAIYGIQKTYLNMPGIYNIDGIEYSIK